MYNIEKAECNAGVFTDGLRQCFPDPCGELCPILASEYVTLLTMVFTNLIMILSPVVSLTILPAKCFKQSHSLPPCSNYAYVTDEALSLCQQSELSCRGERPVFHLNVLLIVYMQN